MKYIFWYIVIVILIIIFIQFTKSKFENLPNDTCILLTTTVNINTGDYENRYNKPEARLKTYTDAINEWLNNTNLMIYIVENNNYNFPEYSENPRVKIFSFEAEKLVKCKTCLATPYEADSILRAFNYFKLDKYDKIIKVTGKYYIPGIEDLINNIPENSELIFQNTHTGNLQNSEIFGCKTKLLPTIMNKIIENSQQNINFEKTLHMISKDYIVYRLPPIKLNKPIRRSGDGLIMYRL